MRLRAIGRFLVVSAAALFAACDAHNPTGGSGAGHVQIAVPPFVLSGFASQTTGGSSNTILASLRVQISIVGESRDLYDHLFGFASVCSLDSTSADVCNLSIDFPIPNGSEGSTFQVQIDGIDPSGVVEYQVGPTQFSLGSDGSSGPVQANARYVGVGSDATGVSISPRSLSLTVGGTPGTLSCVPTGGSATTAQRALIPILVLSSNPAVATAVFTGSGIQVTAISAGTTQINCQLAFGSHAQDVVAVTVTGGGGGGGTGGISGTVRNSSSQVALAGITLELRSGLNNTTGSILNSITTGTAGTYSFTGAAGNYTLRAAGSGFVDNVQNVTFTSAVVTLNVNMVAATGFGAIAGTVTNSQTGAPVANAIVELRAGSNVTTGPLATGTSAFVTIQTGLFAFPGIASGNYTILVTPPASSGLATLPINVTVAANQTTTANASLSGCQAGQVCIILTWGSTPSDLDGHIIMPNGLEVYYGNTATCTASPFVCQDVDQTNGNGPETIRIVPGAASGTYTYYVEDFSDCGGSCSGVTSSNFANSQARVQVYVGTTLVQTFSVPNQPGIRWNVFTVSGSSITVLNTMSTSTGFPPNIRADGSVDQVRSKKALPPNPR